jgi:hypothetical protein
VEAARDNLADAYCRRCGYSLHGLQCGKCPECGGAFDLANRKTFARKPPRLRLKWWARRVAVVVAVLPLAAASVPGWYWWQWHKEQATIEQIRLLGGAVRVRRVEAEGPARYLPAQWAFLRGRARVVELYNWTAEQTAEIDLSPMDRLVDVDLMGSHAGDPVLAQLRGCAELQHLRLSRNPLDGSGLAKLAGCRRLETLILDNTRLTDAGIAHVGRLGSLRELSLSGTAVTDAGVAHLAGLKSLEFLGLQGTAVTDSGLVHLRGLTSLRYVVVSGSRVTERGKRDLREGLPNLTVY